MIVTKIEKPNGLPNNGNTCYINTAIQIIAQILGDFFISGEYHKKLPSDKKTINFMKNFAHLIASIQNNDNQWSELHVKLYLRNIFKYLSSINNFKELINFQQEDSYDFLTKLIDLLSSHLQYKISIEINLKVEKKYLNEKEKTRLIFYKYLKTNLKTTSIIDEKLRGYFRASITCGNDKCNNSSEKFEPFLTFSLPIEGMKTLEECITDYIKPSILDKDNQWSCNKCKQKSQAKKKMSIWTTSEYIFFCYKRYLNLQLVTVKNSQEITTPFHNLDLSLYVEDNKPNENIYDLCAVTFHSGNLNNGHYVIARKMQNGWMVFNDNTVTPIKESDINNRNAYYMVYQRRK